MSNHDLPDKPSYEMAKNFLVTKINFVFIFPQVSLSLTLIFTSADPKCVAENMFRVPGSTQFLNASLLFTQTIGLHIHFDETNHTAHSDIISRYVFVLSKIIYTNFTCR